MESVCDSDDSSSSSSSDAAAHSDPRCVNLQCVISTEESQSECCRAQRSGHGDEMLPSRRTQMDSLVQPLVAQYLAMGCQSKESALDESVTPDEKGKDDA